MKALNKISRIAPCGMNCGICMAFLREKNKCPGCRSTGADKAISVLRCKITNCEHIQKGHVKYCFACDEYPCENLKHLDKRYRTKYRMSMIENLGNIRDSGIRAFVRNEDSRWACFHCGGTMCVHKGYCHTCGKSRGK